MNKNFLKPLFNYLSCIISKKLTLLSRDGGSCTCFINHSIIFDLQLSKCYFSFIKSTQITDFWQQWKKGTPNLQPAHTHPPALFRAWWTSSFTTPLPFSGQSEQKERKAMWEWKSCVILPTATYHQFVYNYKMIYILKVNVHFSLIQLNTYNERKLKLPKYLCHILV